MLDPPGCEAKDVPRSVITVTIATSAKALHLKSTDLFILFIF
jgi:hypothetical protein